MGNVSRGKRRFGMRGRGFDSGKDRGGGARKSLQEREALRPPGGAAGPQLETAGYGDWELGRTGCGEGIWAQLDLGRKLGANGWWAVGTAGCGRDLETAG